MNSAVETKNVVNNEWFYQIMESANESVTNNDIKMENGDLIAIRALDDI